MDLVAGLRRLLFVLLVAAIVGVSSERMFWYWSSNPLDHVVVALVYAPAVAGVLWLMSRYQVRDLVGLVLVAPVLGYLVEGVITPVMYTGGPFVPFFPAWFAAWHGGLGIVVLLVVVRRWSLRGDWKPLLGASAALGVFWGAWSITMTLPENLEDEELIADQGGPLQLLDPGEFTIYAISFTSILAVAHWLLGRGAWMTSLEPSRVTRWVYVAATAAIVVAWTFVIPWAAPMFVVYLGLQVWALRRRARVTSGPTMLEQLAGSVRGVALAPLAAMPVAAATTYAVLWEVELPEDAVRVLMYGVIAIQFVIGAVAMVWSLRRSGRAPAAGAAAPDAGHLDVPVVADS